MSSLGLESTCVLLSLRMEDNGLFIASLNKYYLLKNLESDHLTLPVSERLESCDGKEGRKPPGT